MIMGIEAAGEEERGLWINAEEEEEEEEEEGEGEDEDDEVKSMEIS